MFYAGGASRVINPRIGSGLAGQLRRRECREIKDDLEANAFYLGDGAGRVLLINCDLLWLERDFVCRAAADIEKRTGVPAGQVMISCTHTHAGPFTADLFLEKADTEYVAGLRETLAELAGEAVAGACPVRVGWARGRAHVGYNRRLCWADGSHSMYGDLRRPGFTGLEGPEDPEHAVLFALDEQDRLVALAHNNACHCVCVGSGEFASADFPGYARKLIREAVDAPAPVLYLQGACGDLTPNDQHWKPLKASPFRRMREIGALLAGESLRLMRNAPLVAEAPLAFGSSLLEVDVRLPDEAALAHARKVVARGPGRDTTGNIPESRLFQQEIIALHRKYRDNPRETLPLAALRVGDYALAAFPGELYCQFGLDVKRRSPAAVTAISELNNGSFAYCPTIPAILGEGYSGALTAVSYLEPFAGYRAVEELARLVNALWA